MLYVSLHEISKIIAVFLIAFKDDISDEKAKARDYNFVNELSSIYSVIFHLIVYDWIDE